MQMKLFFTINTVGKVYTRLLLKAQRFCKTIHAGKIQYSIIFFMCNQVMNGTDERFLGGNSVPVGMIHHDTVLDFMDAHTEFIYLFANSWHVILRLRKQQRLQHRF
ncbi:hypothetical protein D3C79_993390 [compost metagenome]